MKGPESKKLSRLVEENLFYLYEGPRDQKASPGQYI